jgi:hypothetical protein
MRDLCDSAKRGQICIDDLCRNNPDNTLCGFDQSEYEQLTRDYDDDPGDDPDDGFDVERTAREEASDIAYRRDMIDAGRGHLLR